MSAVLYFVAESRNRRWPLVPGVFPYQLFPLHHVREMGEYVRQNMVYEKEDLLIDGTGKYHDYNFYRVAGKSIKDKGKGEGINEEDPVDVTSLLP